MTKNLRTKLDAQSAENSDLMKSSVKPEEAKALEIGKYSGYISDDLQHG